MTNMPDCLCGSLPDAGSSKLGGVQADTAACASVSCSLLMASMNGSCSLISLGVQCDCFLGTAKWLTAFQMLGRDFREVAVEII